MEFSKYFTLDASERPRFVMHPSGPASYTAYAFRCGPDMFVTVDDFDYTGNGVRLTIDPLQLRWLAQRLSTARANGVRHIIVQGHLPVTEGYPRVPLPSRDSSRLMLDGHGESAFCQLLRRYHADVYLAGEFHAESVRHYGLYQVVNGCPPYYHIVTYLVGDVYPDRIVLTVKRLTPPSRTTRRCGKCPATDATSGHTGSSAGRRRASPR